MKSIDVAEAFIPSLNLSPTKNLPYTPLETPILAVFAEDRVSHQRTTANLQTYSGAGQYEITTLSVGVRLLNLPI